MIAFNDGHVSIAICDLCGLKHKYTQLREDGAWKQLRVCGQCYQLNNPLKTFVPKEYPYALRYPRPDVLLTVNWEVIQPDQLDLSANDGKSIISGTDNNQDQTGINVNSIAQGPDQNLQDYYNQYVPPSRGGDAGTPEVKNRRFKY